jgi:hypothetical protein
MPSPTWTDVERIGVYCLIRSERGVDLDLQARVCERLRQLLSEGAPAPVAVIAVGDPTLLQPNTVTIIFEGGVHRTSAVASGAEGRFIAFTLRPFRQAESATTITGSTVQVAPMTSESAEGSGLTAALQAALSEIVPWRAPAGLTSRPLQ